MTKKQQIAAAYSYALRFTIQYRAHRIDRMGTFGAASSVQRIDPKSGEVLSELPGKEAKILTARKLR